MSEMYGRQMNIQSIIQRGEIINSANGVGNLIRYTVSDAGEKLARELLRNPELLQRWHLVLRMSINEVANVSYLVPTCGFHDIDDMKRDLKIKGDTIKRLEEDNAWLRAKAKEKEFVVMTRQSEDGPLVHSGMPSSTPESEHTICIEGPVIRSKTTAKFAVELLHLTEKEFLDLPNFPAEIKVGSKWKQFAIIGFNFGRWIVGEYVASDKPDQIDILWHNLEDMPF